MEDKKKLTLPLKKILFQTIGSINEALFATFQTENPFDGDSFYFGWTPVTGVLLDLTFFGAF